ncbi:MAG: hypothetical protein RR980_06730 [Mucinivorans sp.]
MIIKINGIRDPEMIPQLMELNPLYLCFDFRRHVNDYIGEVDEAIYSKIPPKVRKTGIFENDNPLYILSLAGRFTLSTIELEGDESRLDCEILAAEGVELIKTINNISQIEKYEGVCNKFIIRDPEILKVYRGNTLIINSISTFNTHSYGVEVMKNEVNVFKSQYIAKK